MLASRLPGLLPPMTDEEALESAAVQFASKHGFDDRPAGASARSARRITPPRAVALVGGGGNPRPGEISLAHHGVLFLDELPEFDRRVLEVLRAAARIRAHHDLARGAARATSPRASSSSPR